MALKLYNTLTKSKQEFRPINAGKVGFYACGPTVYDYAHIGNLKTFTFEDVLRRYLEYKGFEVRYIMNITDVGHLTADDVNQADSGEDKMLKASLREKKTPEEIANFYTEQFMRDIESLNFKKANYYPRATAHIKQMIRITSELIEKGLAYEKNGNVFYDVSKFKEYGKLSGKKLSELKAGARLEEHPDKKNPFDFALWLKAPKEHILKWESPWSLGYPGWHIECSAMSMEYLGETMDIHTGGEDHIFPHHENEIAQSEGVTGKNFSNFWLHARFLLVNGKKMSKSKGNFYVLKDILDKGYSPMHFRMLALSGHYRTQVNFMWSVMDQAKANYQKIADWLANVQSIGENTPASSACLPDRQAGRQPVVVYDVDFTYIYQKRFEAAMDDDLNTPLALSVVYELITESNKLMAENKLSSETAGQILKFWEKINKVLGLIFEKSDNMPQEIIDLAEARKTARIEKDFQKSDELRLEIEKKGYVVEDLKEDNYLVKIK